jgi:hypothetical protein
MLQKSFPSNVLPIQSVQLIRAEPGVKEHRGHVFEKGLTLREVGFFLIRSNDALYEDFR